MTTTTQHVPISERLRRPIGVALIAALIYGASVIAVNYSEDPSREGVVGAVIGTFGLIFAFLSLTVGIVAVGVALWRLIR